MEGRSLQEETQLIFAYLQMVGLYAPLAFILIHIIRQFLFIPVIVVCIVGGLLFGPVFGSIYSLVGLTLSSLVVYVILKLMPNFHQRLIQIKQKWFGPYARLTNGQISVLKLVPFMHYQLLCLLLLERNNNLKDYATSSFLTNIPTVIFYTWVGQFLQYLSPPMALLLLIALALLIVLLREKVVIIKWKDFFKETA